MTQAFNLAQLANNLNTSGQLDATDGLSGLVANANLASSGTPSSSTFLRGDRTWQSLTQKLINSQTFTNSTRQTFSAAQPITYWTVSYTKQSSTSNLYIICTIPIWTGANGGAYLGFNIDGSINYGGVNINTTASDRGGVTIQQTRTGLSAGARSISVYQATIDGTSNVLLSIINPNNSDDSRNQQQISVMQILEIEP